MLAVKQGVEFAFGFFFGGRGVRGFAAVVFEKH
jgi:hypothetical protein